MTFISLTFLALLALGFLGLPQAEANCGGFNSDIWKSDSESSEGSCSRPSIQKVVEDIADGKDSETDQNEEVKTEATESSFFDTIKNLINFIWMIFKWFSNMNNK